jgi:multimeric flavodoxin WrbA
MTKVGVVYFSGTGTTRRLASYVEQGVENTEATCHLLEIEGADITEGRWQNEEVAASLDSCEAIIFGSPTYMGSVSGQMKCFLDAMVSRWVSQKWNGKIAAGFTASSLSAGDKLNCLFDLTTFAMQMGMIWVGPGVTFAGGMNPNGFYLGVGAVASTPEQLQQIDIDTATHLGQRVAELTGRLT